MIKTHLKAFFYEKSKNKVNFLFVTKFINNTNKNMDKGYRFFKLNNINY